jgi:hypothetical protein
MRLALTWCNQSSPIHLFLQHLARPFGVDYEIKQRWANRDVFPGGVCTLVCHLQNRNLLFRSLDLRTPSWSGLVSLNTHSRDGQGNVRDCSLRDVLASSRLGSFTSCFFGHCEEGVDPSFLLRADGTTAKLTIVRIDASHDILSYS